MGIIDEKEDDDCRGCPEDDFGMGKGVIRRCEIVFKDTEGRGFDSPLFAMALVNQERDMIQDCVEVRWTEKPTEKPKKRKSS